MNRILGLLYGLAVGMGLSATHLILLGVWNKFIDPLLRRLLASEGRYGWNGESLHGIDIIPFAVGAAVYYIGIASACEFATQKWPDRMHAMTAAWTAFSVALLTSIALCALFLLLANAASGFSAFLMTLYALAMGGISGWAAYKGAKEISA